MLCIHGDCSSWGQTAEISSTYQVDSSQITCRYYNTRLFCGTNMHVSEARRVRYLRVVLFAFHGPVSTGRLQTARHSTNRYLETI